MTDLAFISMIDTSHWQGPANRMDLKKTRASGVRGVIAKCTEYGFGVDNCYAGMMVAARNAGLRVGGYFFFHAGNVEAQVEFFLAHAGLKDDMAFAIDHERAPNRTRPSIQDLVEAAGLLEKKVGRKPKIYSGNDIREELGKTNNKYLGEHDWWDASYTSRPLMQISWRTLWMWQCAGDNAGPYAAHCNVPGVGSGIDVNHFMAGTTEDEFNARWASDSSSSSVTKPIVSSDSDVRWAQQALNKLGVAHLTEDGIEGSLTRAAIIEWQKTHDLAQDGIIGPLTKASIKQAYDKDPTTHEPAGADTTVVINTVASAPASAPPNIPEPHDSAWALKHLETLGYTGADAVKNFKEAQHMTVNNDIDVDLIAVLESYVA